MLQCYMFIFFILIVIIIIIFTSLPTFSLECKYMLELLLEENVSRWFDLPSLSLSVYLYIYFVYIYIPNRKLVKYRLKVEITDNVLTP